MRLQIALAALGILLVVAFVGEAFAQEKIVRWPLASSAIGVTLHFEGGRISGVRIVDLADQSEYRKIGLLPEDIIFSINGNRIKSKSELLRVLELHNQDSLGVLRNGNPIEVVYDEESLISEAGGYRQGCLTIKTRPFKFGQAAGLWVASINRFGFFGKAGIKYGDLITHLDGNQVDPAKDESKLLTPKSGMRLTILRASNLVTFGMLPITTTSETIIVRPDFLERFKDLLSSGNIQTVQISF